MATVVPAQPDHIQDIQRISHEAFENFGNYENLLPKFFTTPGVTTYVARIGTDIVGYVMLGFIPWSACADKEDAWICELLALAIEPGRRGQGIGSSIMLHVFNLVEQMCEWRNVCEIQLVCPENDTDALRFFSKHGFSRRCYEMGAYADGQKAHRLFKPVVDLPAS